MTQQDIVHKSDASTERILQDEEVLRRMWFNNPDCLPPPEDRMIVQTSLIVSKRSWSKFMETTENDRDFVTVALSITGSWMVAMCDPLSRLYDKDIVERIREIEEERRQRNLVDTSSAMMDRLGFSDAEKTVLSTMVDILEDRGDVLDYVKGLLADAVPSLLDADPEPFEEEGYGRKLLQIWESSSEDQQPTNTILDELGFVGKRGRIIIECAERYQESVEKFCHDNIISVAEGIIEAPEILGMPISENLLKWLKEDKEKEN